MGDGSYLQKSNWPECIPWTEPTEKYAPASWKPVDDPKGLDDYNWSHPSAASIGDTYAGDVCPWCGVPLRFGERVVTRDGSEGELWRVSPNSNPKPSYHPDCYTERMTELNESLEAFQQ